MGQTGGTLSTEYHKPDFVQVGPLKNALEVRLSPHADGEPTGVVLSGARAYARYLLAWHLADNIADRTTKTTFNQLTEALTRPFVAVKREAETYLRWTGLNIVYDEQAVAEMSKLHDRVKATYSRYYPQEDDQGNIIGWEFRPGTINPEDKTRAKQVLDHLGWNHNLFPFAYEGAQEILTKRDVLLAAPVGTGKTRFALALAECWKYMDGTTTPTIILANKRHLGAWREELGGVPEKAPCELLVAQYGHGCYEEWIEKDDNPKFDKPFLLVSLDRAKIFTEAQLARFLKVAETSPILLDEAYVISNRSSQVSKFIQKVSGTHHIALSGTPIKGYVDSLLHLLQFTHRGGSVAFPDYPTHRDGAAKRWAEKFMQYAVAEGGGRRRVPFIKNQDEFWTLLQPLMFRMLRNEPQIESVLGPANIEQVHVEVELKPQHQRTYKAVLKQFIDWYTREIEARRKRGESAVMPEQEILIKLGYLVNNVRAPWRMEDHSDEEFKWPVHPREMTSVHEKAIELLEHELDEGHSVIIFGISVDAMKLLAEQVAERNIPVGFISGEINQAARDEVVARARRGELRCIIGTYGTLAEGLNLSFASRVILTDTDWSPSTMKQALGRITRGIQEVAPKAYFIEAIGTIQSYMVRLNLLKQSAIDAGLDRRKLMLGEEDIPDITAYINSLVGVGDEEEVQERLFWIEEDAI